MNPYYFQFSSFQSLSCVWLLWPHGLQYARPLCPLPTPGVYPNSCPLSKWCHSTISSSVLPFSYLQSFPAWGSFPMSQFFTSGGQNVGVSALASVLPMNTQDWFPLGWTGWISLLSKGLSRVFSNTTVQKHQFFGTQAFFIVQLSHPYMTTGKTIALTRLTFVGKVMSLLFNILSRLAITFLPRGKRLLISWLQSPSAVILEPPKIKSDTVFPSICHGRALVKPHLVIFKLKKLTLKSSTDSTVTFRICVGGFGLRTRKRNPECSMVCWTPKCTHIS